MVWVLTASAVGVLLFVGLVMETSFPDVLDDWVSRADARIEASIRLARRYFHRSTHRRKGARHAKA